jgi:dolichol-phosphate mannosyltransferase
MDPIELSVILPAYHEEENLRVLLPRLIQVLKTLGHSFEILVIDTESPLDHTEQVCEEFGVKCLRRKEGNSFGNAVRTGISEAKGKYFLFMDADGSHTPEFIGDMFCHRQHYDVVIASRYVSGGFTENLPVLVLMSYFLNLTYRVVLNLKCKDVSNSFKLYRAQYLKGLELFSDNFDIIEEILFKLSRNYSPLRIKEIPFSFKKRMFGETKRKLIVFIMAYLVTIIKLRLSTFPFLFGRRKSATRKQQENRTLVN